MSKLVEKVVAANPSPYPASFDGSTLRFQLALFALMSVTILGGMMATWMGRELWRGRHDAYPWEGLFAIRGIFFTCAIIAIIRSGPEAAFMISYREGSPEILANILMVKRWLDAFVIIPALAWMGMAWIFYPPIASQMIKMSRQAPVAPKFSPMKAKRMAMALSLTFAISALIAIGKQ